MLWLAGQPAAVTFTVYDLDDQPVVGLTAPSFSIGMYRRIGAGAFTPAPESISITNLGGGWYNAGWTFAGDAAGYTYHLTIVETPFTNSAQARHEFSDLVSVANALAAITETDAFCSLNDVQMRLGRGAFSATTTPTSSDVLVFMSTRAREIESVMHTHGLAYTVPSGAAPIDATTQTGRVLANLARQANAFGAAADSVSAFNLRDQEEASARAKSLWGEYRSTVKSIADFARKMTGTAGQASSYTGSGTLNGEPPYSLGTKW